MGGSSSSHKVSDPIFSKIPNFLSHQHPDPICNLKLSFVLHSSQFSFEFYLGGGVVEYQGGWVCSKGFGGDTHGGSMTSDSGLFMVANGANVCYFALVRCSSFCGGSSQE